VAIVPDGSRASGAGSAGGCVTRANRPSGQVLRTVLGRTYATFKGCQVIRRLTENTPPTYHAERKGVGVATEDSGQGR